MRKFRIEPNRGFYEGAVERLLTRIGVQNVCCEADGSIVANMTEHQLIEWQRVGFSHRTEELTDTVERPAEDFAPRSHSDHGTLFSTTPGQSKENERAERLRLKKFHKDAWREVAGVIVTDEMIGRKARPNSKDPRNQVTKWQGCNEHYDGTIDRAIRQVLQSHAPHYRGQEYF
jgi:hypothetical protein